MPSRRRSRAEGPGERAPQPRPVRGLVRARRAGDRCGSFRGVPHQLRGGRPPPPSMGAGRLAAPTLDRGTRARDVADRKQKARIPTPRPMEDGGQSPPKPRRAFLVPGSGGQLGPTCRSAPPLDWPARRIRRCADRHPSSRRPPPSAMGDLQAKILGCWANS